MHKEMTGNTVNQTVDNLTIFREKHAQWSEWLDGNDRNSISNQLIRLAWDAAIFRLVNKAIELAPRDEQNHPKVNGLVYNTFTRWYLVSQAAAIRRLADKGKMPGHPVCSLHTIISDIKDNSELLSRGNLFAIENLPYDFEQAEKDKEQWFSERLAEGGGSWSGSIPRRFWTDSSRERHVLFDKVSCVEADKRSPHDSINKHFLENLLGELETRSESITTHVNKFVAHAADPRDREGVKGFTYGEMWQAEKMVCKIFDLLNLLLRNASTQLLPFTVQDLFVYIERGLIEDVSQKDQLEVIWKEFEKEVGNWGSIREVDELIRDCTNGSTG